MNKLTMHTPDITEGNIKKIALLFPNVVTEKEGADGVTTRAIDFDLLRQTLSSALVDDDSERYRLDWPGKKASLLKANTPITKTLRPDRESSVNFDTTENVFIEGDNFEVLKVLQESYLGKVKMIYIDPPYNTGKDFVYRDNRTVSKEDYEEELGVEDEEGGKLFRNTDTNGRFHSDWLSMVYERLLVARDLMKEDGVIFISIDDNELTNLKKICDEIFGENNFIENFIWIKRTAPNNVVIGSVHEYILSYAKNKELVSLNLLPRDGEKDSKYSNPDNDPRGDWSSDNITSPAKGGRMTKSLFYEIVNPVTGTRHLPPKGRMWSVTEEDMLKKMADKSVYWGKDGDGRPMNKRFLSETRNGMTISTLLDEVGSNSTASKDLSEIFDGEVIFETPKPLKLIKLFTTVSTQKEDIVLDFFAGSCATAHSVMQLNGEDGGNRKFVMVQIPEKTEEGSEAYKAKYEYITDISKERIRRAGKKILEENAEAVAVREKPLDIGFRAYKADTTNMKDVYYHPSAVAQEDLFNNVSNIKEDRTPEDLLTQVILDLGLTLDLPVEKKDLRGNAVYFVAGNALVACFDDKIDFGIVDDIAKYEPLKVVFKDASFKEEQDRTNVDTRFKRLSPDTIITVL